ncbi:hypothetical protein [Phytohabitans houttuyneae]|uniref:Phytanoyl-CoA dioxygenase family protein n=1 Tax=Phytohabitans houttuyneae TaxID=1076126 RepID=A0A6V8KDG6_9ACTN|nr:hypothetical protein [Phytohabitans houttuyneae]GFJ81480.1 hypothetical protein Phou_056600 [Phytohabitans houttuyneae]
MELEDAARAWQTDGFVILPGFLPAEELKPAVGELDLLFRLPRASTTAPTHAATFHRRRPARSSPSSRAPSIEAPS